MEMEASKAFSSVISGDTVLDESKSYQEDMTLGVLGTPGATIITGFHGGNFRLIKVNETLSQPASALLPNFQSGNENMTASTSSLPGALPIDMQFNNGHIISISVYSVLFVLSSVGNITLLLAILKRKHPLQSLSRIDFLLLHLAIADLIVTFFMMPLEIGWAATVHWIAGDLMCRLMAFLRIFGLYLSGFVLVCLAIDRYMAVAHPLRGLASSKRAKVMVSVAWLLSFICSLPQVLVFRVLSHPEFKWYTQCVTFNSFRTPHHELLYKVFGMVMMYALPLVLLVGLYSSIAFHLHKMCLLSTTSSIEFPNIQPQTANHVNPATAVGILLRRTGGDRIERAKINSIKMTFVITAVFLVCWTPYYVMCIWYWIDPESAKNVDQRVQKFLFLFASTNSTVNPIVYGIFHWTNIAHSSERSRC